MGPPTATLNDMYNWALLALASSVDHVLELLHRKRLHGLGRRLRFECTWLLRERVHALARWPSGLLLQLQVQGPTELEGAVLLHLRCHEAHVRLHSTFHVTCLHTCGLRHCAVGSRRRHGFGTRRFHHFHCLHRLHRFHGLGRQHRGSRLLERGVLWRRMRDWWSSL